jgi:hypothetical protein
VASLSQLVLGLFYWLSVSLILAILLLGSMPQLCAKPLNQLIWLYAQERLFERHLK